ncbi:MAG: UDP-glucose/GDP-mannose dehydrogenase family protein [Candidatus Dadabacteria bacterium]|nr:MAG: UDP-glucose/GDP-mannose dehydrogenase family protein [Candidatus Dadabacteria bacterium]
MTRISVIGTGYVGLVSAAGFAALGHDVIGYDIDEQKIATLESGGCPIYEPGLEELLAEGRASGRLRFTADLGAAVAASDVVFVCVGTPQADDGTADLTQVEAVARDIAAHMTEGTVVVEKSTVPVKTAQWIRRTIELCGGRGFSVASNPEFLREGSAVQDFLEPERIVLGVADEQAREALLDIYAGIDCPKVVVDIETAEIIKHASNSFLAMKISYINMIADLCEAVGADVRQVAEGMGLDSRIGPKFLAAGIGYGGSCFPKDVRAFMRIAEQHDVNVGLLDETDRINEARVARLVARMRNDLWNLKGKKIALWGLAFKPGTDDVREAPSLRLARQLHAEGAILTGWDPVARETFLRAVGELPVEICDSPQDAAAGADAVIVVTDWPELREVDLASVAGRMRSPYLFDGRNWLDPEACASAGFWYRATGRPGVETVPGQAS